MSYYGWKPYVPVAQRRANARKALAKLFKKGAGPSPVEVEGRTIASSFWGKGWCDHMDSFSDFSNRLPRGRTYVRNGSVVHLEIREGEVEAMVSGSELYKVKVEISPLKAAKWKAIQKRCAGRIGSMLELLQGRLSGEVMSVVSDSKEGLFPLKGEIKFKCSCPDWASMCKHVAAVFYGVGNRLDTQPELLFKLRGVDPGELVAGELALTTAGADADVLAADQVGDIFGIDLDMGEDSPSVADIPPGRATAGSGKQPKASAKAKSGRAAATKKTAPKKGARKKTASFQATGKGVATLRKALGLSVPEFAGRLDVSAASVYRWEAIKGPVNFQNRILLRLQGLFKEIQS
jgi:uncharacterized Zn finger protein